MIPNAIGTTPRPQTCAPHDAGLHPEKLNTRRFKKGGLQM